MKLQAGVSNADSDPPIQFIRPFRLVSRLQYRYHAGNSMQAMQVRVQTGCKVTNKSNRLLRVLFRLSGTMVLRYPQFFFHGNTYCMKKYASGRIFDQFQIFKVHTIVQLQIRQTRLLFSSADQHYISNS